MSDALKPTSKLLCSNIMIALDKHYPAFKNWWLISIDEKGGIVKVMNVMLSGRMGFILHTSKIDAEMKSIVRAGGELLERHRVLRGRNVSLETAMQDTTRKVTGDMVFDK